MDKHVEKSRKKLDFYVKIRHDCLYACKLSDIMKYCLCKFKFLQIVAILDATPHN